ncbi:MAG: hypothetical protein QXP02_05475 [Desulfurococcaceae archaeon]
MKVAIVYYSRTGNTERVVYALKDRLTDLGILVDVYRVLPITEYAKPLHLNPRLIRDTLVRRDTDIVFKPGEPRLQEYDLIVMASPVWYNTIAPPIQGFLRRHVAGKPLVVITTSGLSVDYSEKIKRVVKELSGVEPIFCVNIVAKNINRKAELDEIVKGIAEKIVRRG